ncbi:hypothetical protein BGZ96_010191 [Linnemannia gamsii]|uniref:Thioesterase n=1 Tax=Linnemannia gamsii TaxID=64522 RepID=A0ABQ7JVU2_9FUNG|nr:hypothetical protein BGZ96_010191 [Linnemannia gamsii]
MNKFLLSLPAPLLQQSANLISFYFQHVRPLIPIVRKYIRRLILLILLANFKSLPGVFHAKMGFRILMVQLYSIRYGRAYRIKPTETSVVRERVWFDDLDLNLHFSNRIVTLGEQHITSLLGPTVLPYHPFQKLTFALGGTQMWFKKEIRLFQTYEIRTRLLSWNQKWFIIEHRMFTPGRGKTQTLFAIGLSKFVLKFSGGSWKGKTAPFLDALEIVGHDVRQLRVLEAKVKAGGGGGEAGNVLPWPKEELRFEGYDGWTDRGTAVGNTMDLCEHLLLKQD